VRLGVTAAVRFDLASSGAASRLKSSLDARSVAIDILLNDADTPYKAIFRDRPFTNSSHLETPIAVGTVFDTRDSTQHRSQPRR
jgi:hypothetical protein